MGMKRFHLERIEDESGVSGTGRVAEGVEFANGYCAMTWLTPTTSVTFYTTIGDVEKIHGHHGKTRVVIDEEDFSYKDEVERLRKEVKGLETVLDSVNFK